LKLTLGPRISETFIGELIILRRVTGPVTMGKLVYRRPQYFG